MILTKCAACAAPLAYDAPRCVRCHTRYCDATCQHDHWRRGHKQICKRIHRGGNAEQYHADKKYKEAVAEAVEACAEDTKGQTCYICTQALHWKTKEGLVRGCSCRGTAGFVHVSCLMEQAKILFAEAVENNLGDAVINERGKRWKTCDLCKQNHHGVVRRALGWACWKTYASCANTQSRERGMYTLANGLRLTGSKEDALEIFEAGLAMYNHFHPGRMSINWTDGIASCLDEMGRHEEALPLVQVVYDEAKRVLSQREFSRAGTAMDDYALNYALSLAMVLRKCGRYSESKPFLSEQVQHSLRVLGPDHVTTLRLRCEYAQAIAYTSYVVGGGGIVKVNPQDRAQAISIVEDAHRRMKRVLGANHQLTKAAGGILFNLNLKGPGPK